MLKLTKEQAEKLKKDVFDYFNNTKDLEIDENASKRLIQGLNELIDRNAGIKPKTRNKGKLENTKRTVNKELKSNIKCEHCEHFCRDYSYDTESMIQSNFPDRCGITGECKHYWNRCKNFEWKKKYNEQ